MKRAATLAALGAALALSGCLDQGPDGGTLAVRLAAPRPGDRAVSFVLVGPHASFTAPWGSGYRVFSLSSADGDTAYVAVVAPSGGGLAAGVLAVFGAPDASQVSRYSVTVTDVARSDYTVGDTAGVALSVYHP